MKLRFKISIITSALLMVISYCEKTGHYVYSGRIIDQSTKQPVAGATVYFGHNLCDPLEPGRWSNVEVTSGSDGTYKLIVPISTFSTTSSRAYSNCTLLWATKEGYIGSDENSAPAGGADEDIELYHYAYLNLHVKNDTIINKIDRAIVRVYQTVNWSDFYMNYTGTDYHGIECQGKTFDKVYTYDLWAGKTYYVDAVETGYNKLIPIFYNNLNLKPDSITYFSISF